MAEHLTLGDEVVDSITGFKGIATGRAEYLTGCVQVCVAATSVANAKPVSEWYDISRLRLINKARIVPKTEDIGGPQFTPETK